MQAYSQVGTLWDNPTNPMTMNDDQRERVVEFRHEICVCTRAYCLLRVRDRCPATRCAAGCNHRATSSLQPLALVAAALCVSGTISRASSSCSSLPLAVTVGVSRAPPAWSAASVASSQCGQHLVGPAVGGGSGAGSWSGWPGPGRGAKRTLTACSADVVGSGWPLHSGGAAVPRRAQ